MVTISTGLKDQKVKPGILLGPGTGTVPIYWLTGHHDPAVQIHAVINWDVDAFQPPVNPVRAVLGGFIDRVIPAARECGIG
jgi:hypothetical protein